MESLGINAKSVLEDYVVDSNEILRFKLIRSESDIENDEAEFSPEMTHQIYGENENIFGYRGLKVDFWMLGSSLRTFIRMNYDEKVSEARSEGVKPDLVMEPLLKLLEPGQNVENLDDFVKAIKKDETFVPYGSKIASFTLDGRDKVVGNYEIYQCDEKVPGFRKYHSYLQPWIMFYIDAASYIDIDDENWRFFLLYQRLNGNDGIPRYVIAGYITVYQYYAYPDKIRPRISQMLILPPFQKRGLGAKLLNTVCQSYWKNPKVVDITVEDPSDDFIRLRDFVDCRNSINLECFSEKKLKGGFNDEMVKEANEHLKLCKRQTRRVYEILRLHKTKRNDYKEYKDYRVDVKKRLNQPYQKEERQLEKLQKVLKPEEYTAATVNILNRETRLENLQNLYHDLEEHYLQVLERIAAS